MLSLKFSDHGLRQFQRRLSRTHFNRARRRALNEGSNYLLRRFREFSRIKTGAFVAAWHRRKLSDEAWEIFNDVVSPKGRHYAKFVTATSQSSTWDPRDEAGDAMIRHVIRAEKPEARRIMQETFRREMAR